MMVESEVHTNARRASLKHTTGASIVVFTCVCVPMRCVRCCGWKTAA